MELGASNFANVVTEHSGTRKECILWCVNHYLSLNRKPNVIDKAADALRKYGTGCGTSAASCGMSSLHKQIEKKVAEVVGKEKAILYSTGFTANVAAISYLAGKDDLIIFDRESHSSLINGLKLAEAKWISFKHNNVKDLELKLRKYRNSYRNIFVVVESAYSMSGDLAPLREIVALKRDYNFYLYVDEAHTFGIYGDKGQGYCHEQGVTDEVDFIMSTLSKATASIGGFVAARKEYCSLLKWSDPYVFQACISPSDAAVVLACLEEIEQNPGMIRDLHEKNRYMRDLLASRGFNLGDSQSPIIPIFIEDHRKLQLVVRELYQEGIYSTPICFPAVKVDEGRIRLILNAAHTREHIDATVEALEKVCRKHQVIGGQEDAVTGLFNRACLDYNLEKAFRLAVRKEKPVSFAVVSVDGFGKITGTFSEETGKKVLKEIASVFKSSMRSSDIASRYGDDTFGLVFLNAAATDLRILCERLIARVRDTDWNRLAEGLQVVISIGLADSRGCNTVEGLKDNAIACLEQAKTDGGNVVVSRDLAGPNI
jgi:8-amino-7-oxononanoate synthase